MTNLIDEKREYISGVLTRNSCININQKIHLKDLNRIENRELKDLVIVDNNVSNFAFQMNNGIPILKWNGDKNDKELEFLQNFLIQISSEHDLRDSIQTRFNLEQLPTIYFE